MRARHLAVAVSLALSLLTGGAIVSAAKPAPRHALSTVSVSRCIGTTTQCTLGQWTVKRFKNHVRAVHTVVLSNGKILFMAGSGNDPMMFAAGTFTSTLWDPRTNVWRDIPTPDDVFCSGHVQLPDGNVLILGGVKAYPALNGNGVSTGYEGVNTSYIFNIHTDQYEKVNNLNTGMWYPSATELGNGNVFSMGGHDQNGMGLVTNEEFDTKAGKWLAVDQTPQQYDYFGTYPANILRSNGTLFYSGSYVLGAQSAPHDGADIINLANNKITAVRGLQDPNERDQSAAVLLPPAQDQRVMVLGGGNVDTNVTANRFTDIVNLTDPRPRYVPGPKLPRGEFEMGDDAKMTMTDPGVQPEKGGMGKMYVSAVLLPDRTVFETGGALHDRADPVYEASDYNPLTNKFTEQAVDPVERMYHSESVLYQNGEVISVGSNPADGSFDMRISVYKPPYLFWSHRPIIASVSVHSWKYGATPKITSSEPIESAEIIKPSAVTHSSDPNQRLIDLPLITVKGTDTYRLAVSANDNLIPPGFYMLFVQNTQGVPSRATWVHVGAVTSAAPAVLTTNLVRPRKPVKVSASSDGCKMTKSAMALMRTTGACVPLQFSRGDR